MDDSDKTADQATSDAAQLGKSAVDNAASVASDAKQATSNAIADGREYAKQAVNAAGKKITDFQSQLDQGREYLVKTINEDPVRAVVIAGAVSSLLTALLMSALRSDDRYF